jgi:hypothetical protein
MGFPVSQALPGSSLNRNPAPVRLGSRNRSQGEALVAQHSAQVDVLNRLAGLGERRVGSDPVGNLRVAKGNCGHDKSPQPFGWVVAEPWKESSRPRFLGMSASTGSAQDG